jgi:hypothetical protein
MDGNWAVDSASSVQFESFSFDIILARMYACSPFLPIFATKHFLTFLFSHYALHIMLSYFNKESSK